MYISNNRQVTTTVKNHQSSGKKKKKKKAKSESSETTHRSSNGSFGKFMSSPRMIQVYGIILMAFALLLLVSMISYMITFDPDLHNCIEQNWAGIIGAYLSYFFVNQIFGFFSIGFVFLFFIYGMRLTFEQSKISLFKATITTFLSMSWLSLLFGFFIHNDITDLVAGRFGRYFADLMMEKTGGFVSALIMVIFLLAILILCYNFSVKDFCGRVAGVGGLFHRRERNNNDEEKVTNNAKTNTTKPEEHQELPGLYIQSRDGLSQQVGGTVYEFPEIQKPMTTEEFLQSCKQSVGETLTQPEKPEEKNEVPFEITSNFVKPAEENQEETTGDPIEIKPEVEETESNSEEETPQTALPMEDYDPRKDLSTYTFPPIDLLNEYEVQETDKKLMMQELRENKEKIEKTLNNFKIPITKITATIGPTVTLYEIVPDAGIRISKIKGLEDDIALSLAALGIRIIAPIPGKGTIGIEVPNKNPKTVSMREIIASDRFQNNKYDLPLALGKTISDEAFVVDLAKMPHLLVAGATGQGKSVGLNAIITSLLYKKHPSELKLVMVDPKKLEFSLYSKIEKHYLAMLPDSDEPIITDTKKVVRTLNSLCVEMDARYDLMKLAQTRNIKEYNAKFCARQLSPTNGHRYMPYIVVVIDEFGDLIITAGREVETPITRLAQLARACGIHLIIATQRPTTTIITGNIKANFPAQIAFRVGNKIDSRVILDQNGADQLIGKGDMLIKTGSDLVRLQCAFVDTPEVGKIADYISDQQSYPEPYYLPEYAEEEPGANDMDAEGGYSGKIDSCFMDAATLIVQTQQGSTSLIQRKMNLGYNRAGRIMDQLEEFNIVGPSMGSKAREVKVHSLEELRVILTQMGII